MKAFEDFIGEYRRRVYGLFGVAVRDIIYRQRFTIAHNNDFSAFELYFDYPDYYYMITFPTDILYVKLKKGNKELVDYINYKLEF